MTGRVLFFLLVLSGAASAQFDSESAMRGFDVHVILPPGTECDSSIRVTLMGNGGPLSSGILTRDCVAHFLGLRHGNYDVSVSGVHFATVDGGRATVDAMYPDVVEVRVTRGEQLGVMNAGNPLAPLIAVNDFNVPASARKELDKGNEFMSKQDFARAIQRFNKAIALYPSYADAYNNLGVVYARLENRERERESLEKAVSINDHFAPAYANLGRLNIAAGDIPQAEVALSKAHALSPNDVNTAVLLAYTQVTDGHLDEALVTSRQVHALSQGGHAFVHMAAANAYERKHAVPSAVSELETFLKEEPTGARADSARKALQQLQAAVH